MDLKKMTKSELMLQITKLRRENQVKLEEICSLKDTISRVYSVRNLLAVVTAVLAILSILLIVMLV